GAFYPQSLRPSDYLAFYARQFDTVELDTTFHAVPPPERVAGWANAVPDDFRFTAKVPKAITHEPGLDEKSEAFVDFARCLKPLGDKLGRVLLQFPPTTGVEIARPLNRLLDDVGHLLPLAVEIRHPSWFTGQALPALHERGVTVVANDYLDRAQPLLGPSGCVYVRLIGEHDRFPTKDQERYDVQDRLAWWVDQIMARATPKGTVYVTVNNDYAGHSPATIRRLRQLVGLPDTTPEAGSPEAATLFG
ncbi:MAG TPA: DUF72 domain-containing protein, partial [Tepidisphaeraceae bacterium]